MRRLLLVTSLLAAVSVSGCSQFGLGHRDSNYAKARTIAPVTIPKGTDAPTMRAYYPVPNLPAQANTAPPSIIPPGSHILEHMKKYHGHGPVAQAEAAKASASGLPQAKAKSTTQLQTQTSEDSIAIKANVKVAWRMVGKALAHTPYQVLDKDTTLGSYYVLDSQQTHDKVTANTPIYRIRVKQSGHFAVVSVYDRDNAHAGKVAATKILATLKHAIETV